MVYSELAMLSMATFTWKVCSVTGKVPAPCFGHSMNVYRNSPQLIVFGGEMQYNDKMQLREFNSSTHLLTLEGSDIRWKKLLCHN